MEDTHTVQFNEANKAITLSILRKLYSSDKGYDIGGQLYELEALMDDALASANRDGTHRQTIELLGCCEILATCKVLTDEELEASQCHVLVLALLCNQAGDLMLLTCIVAFLIKTMDMGLKEVTDVVLACYQGTKHPDYGNTVFEVVAQAVDYSLDGVPPSG